MKTCPNCGIANQPGARFCSACGTTLAPTTLPLGLTFHGRYSILKLLGRGGMASVYQVSDAHLGGKLMALKEFSDAGITDPRARAEAVAAFNQEAHLLARLDHPNIPKVTDFFTEGGKHYIVMEFVPGESLEVISARSGGRCAEADVRGWALQLCDVLGYMHGQNPPVIYRDLKPGNIMLTPQGQVKLVDFGIARLFKIGKPGDTQVMGTPGFAAPEQYGQGQTDARSDIYAFGVVLHTLLTGHDPASTPFALPPARQLNPGVSPQLEAIIGSATQMDPNLRYQSAAQLRAALLSRRGAGGTTIVMPGGKTAQPTRRGPGAAILVAVLVVALIGIAAAAFAMNRPQTAWTPPSASTESAVTEAAAATLELTAIPSPEAEVTESAATAAAEVELPTTAPSATLEPPTATIEPPTATPVPPTPTLEPTATLPPVPTATPGCALAADPALAGVWERGVLGCAVGPAGITWGAWQPFERGAMYWRSDLNTVYVLFNNGSWFEILDKWDGYATASRGSPPAGLRAPERGFGWVWGTRDDVFNGLGWALDQEKGFCAAVQSFESGVIFQSSRVQSCQGDLYNWATHPDFRPLLFRVRWDGTWRMF